jgi:hypothetical protein
MKGYRKIIEQSVSFCDKDLEMGEFADTMDMSMRGIMGEMINHAEDKKSLEYVIVVYAKKIQQEQRP